MSDGDARVALNGLQSVLRAATQSGNMTVTSAEVMKCLERNHVQYDRAGKSIVAYCFSFAFSPSYYYNFSNSHQ